MIELARSIINDKITKVSIDRFEMINRHVQTIKQLDGDIIECGIWKGGMGIFLCNLFPEKQIWLSDSFEGFEDKFSSKYIFQAERHMKGGMAVSYNEVIDNFNRYNIDIDKIKFLRGFVNDTLPAANIESIALLRIDVDAYSATREVLEHLYDKVVPNGYIIFDDTCLYETRHAIIDFFNDHKINIKLRHPITDQYIDITHDDMPCGCYIIKE